MCFTALLGAGVSALGQASANQAANRNVRMAAAQQIRQIDQDTAEMRARNRVLNERFLPAQEQFAEQNQGILRDVFATADGSLGRIDDTAAAREAAILGAMTSGGGAPQMSASAEGGAIAQIFQQALEAARGRAQNQGRATARVGAADESLVRDNETYRRAGQRIDQVNDFSRGDIGLLSPQLTLTGFQQQPPIPAVNMRSGAAGQTMMALGQAIGGGAFDDILSRAGRSFTPAVRAAPTGRASIPAGMTFNWQGR